MLQWKINIYNNCPVLLLSKVDISPVSHQHLKTESEKCVLKNVRNG